MAGLDDASVSSDFELGQSVLISGPPMTGKKAVYSKALTEGAAHIIVVTTEGSADQVRETVRNGGGDPSALSIVDCVSKQRNVADTTNTEDVKYVSSPTNLTQIGVQFTSFLDRDDIPKDDPDRPVHVGFHSLSPVLMQVPIKHVYQFLEVITGQIQSMGWRGFFVVDSAMFDEQALATIQHPFDAVIETRERGDDREMRVRGSSEPATKWRTI